ncbi:MAG TPA: DUF4350 domain-containing protein [Holophagaceae bacterium]|nr:DUF4350 domain-containing protein [Holophagaceae bacterium]
MRRLLLLLLAALGLGALTVIFLARPSFRREPVEVPTGWSAKALEDDTLVLERWLARQGWRVRRAGGVIRDRELPPGGLLILLHTAPGGLGEADVDALLAWVKAGGHLLVDGSAAPSNDGRGTAALFNRLGAELVSVPEKERTSSDHTDTFTEDGSVYALRRSPQWRIQVDPDAWTWRIGGKSGQVLVRRAEGRGRVILTSDLSYLYNRSFPDLDHAAWLARILGPPTSGQAAVVWSLPEDPSLLTWLWARAWAFLLACGVLLLVWLWAGFWRFGPWLPEVPGGRRSLLEHLVASGRFLWRHGGGPEALVTAARKAVLRRAARLHPAFPALPELERWAYLAGRGGLPEADIAEALDDRPESDVERLSRRLQILLHLHHRLSLKP